MSNPDLKKMCEEYLYFHGERSEIYEEITTSLEEILSLFSEKAKNYKAYISKSKED